MRVVVVGVVCVFIFAGVMNSIFGMPDKYSDVHYQLSIAYEDLYGDDVFCRYEEVSGRNWLGCWGGKAPLIGVWELVDRGGSVQCLAANGKAQQALSGFPWQVMGYGIGRSDEGMLPSAVLDAFNY